MSDEDVERLKDIWRAHRRRLSWIYGPERAVRIINGLDDEANQDRAKWYALGRSRHDAAP